MLVVSLCCTVFLTAISTECFRVLQAANYRPRRAVGYFATKHFLLIVACQLVETGFFLHGFPIWTAVVPYAICGVLTVFVRRKCPLAYTKRVVRMLALFAVLSVAFCCLSPWFCAVCVPPLTLFCWICLLPVEGKINKRYINSGTKKLTESNVKVIAVVGSYGKTSVKNMLTELLDGAVCPQGSVNTPLGIAKFINGADLAVCKYLVLEFGARQPGDIAELCKFYPPYCGVIVGVCPQHIATFGSFDNVLKEKSAILHLLPSEGICILNGADEKVRSWVDVGECKKVISRSFLSAEVVKREISGQTLSVRDKERCFSVKLPQIADYTVNTFLLCAETCLALGQSLADIVKNSVRVTQTPHRMEVRAANGFYIVDDSYNGGIKSVESSCATLGAFDCKLVAIAQGIVECGKKTEELNVACGAMLGRVFNVVVLCGKNAKFIAKGLSNTDTTVLFARDVTDATNKALRYIGKGDILYYQNDLPDTPML